MGYTESLVFVHVIQAERLVLVQTIDALKAKVQTSTAGCAKSAIGNGTGSRGTMVVTEVSAEEHVQCAEAVKQYLSSTTHADSGAAAAAEGGKVSSSEPKAAAAEQVLVFARAVKTYSQALVCCAMLREEAKGQVR